MVYSTSSSGIRIFLTSVKIHNVLILSELKESIDVRGMTIIRDYGYSIDGITYFRGIETIQELIDQILLDANLSLLNDFTLYLMFRYDISKGIDYDDKSYFHLNYIELDSQELTDFSVELGERLENTIIRKTGNSTFNPYKYNDNAKRLYEEMSIGISEMFGFDVIYFRTESSSEHKSVVFKLYELNNVVEVKKFKLSIKDNEIPEALEKYDDLGFDFQNELIVHIVKNIFEKAFGVGMKPNSNDFFYLPLTDKMYQVNSPYDPKTFMQFAPFWELMTTKYEKRSTVEQQNNIDQFHKVDDMLDFSDAYLADDENLELQDSVKDYNSAEQLSNHSMNHAVSKESPKLKNDFEVIYSFDTNALAKNIVAKTYDFFQDYEKELFLTMWLKVSSATNKIFTLQNSSEKLEFSFANNVFELRIETSAETKIVTLPKIMNTFFGFGLMINESTFELSIILLNNKREIISSVDTSILLPTAHFNSISFYGKLKYSMLRGCKKPSKYHYEELLFDDLLPTKKDFVVIQNATPILITNIT